MFDFLIVGAGLFGATLANILTENGYNVLVVEREDKVGGTVSTYWTNDICVHEYGAHIFRTNDPMIWDYITSFDEFVPFINEPLAIHNGTVYNLPFNMNTFSRLWNIRTPNEARKIIQSQIDEYGLNHKPENLEQYAISQVGLDIYNTFIREYTEKQWGKPCSELPLDIMKRIPIRFTYNNNYYNAKYCGIPKHGYSKIVKDMLKDSTVFCGIDGKSFIKSNPTIANHIIYTGCIDEFYGCIFGRLEYRSLKFDTFYLSDIQDFQGNAVVNYSDLTTDYTRIVEHKHFLNTDCLGTVITKEYPQIYDGITNYPYYPINDVKNTKLYERYNAIDTNIIFAGRLGNFKYVDMEDTIYNALDLATDLLSKL